MRDEDTMQEFEAKTCPEQYLLDLLGESRQETKMLRDTLEAVLIEVDQGYGHLGDVIKRKAKASLELTKGSSDA